MKLRTQIIFLFLVLLFLNGCASKSFDFKNEQMASVKAMRVVETVKSQIGKKYLWGGTDPRKGFDCSGLLWWSFKQNKVNIPRSTKDQAKTGLFVNKYKMRAGDILVFRLSGNLHTGIYAGKGNFIHSPSSGKRVQQVTVSEFWQDALVGVRRVKAISAPR